MDNPRNPPTLKGALQSERRLILRNAARTLDYARMAADYSGAIEEIAEFVGWLKARIAAAEARQEKP